MAGARSPVVGKAYLTQVTLTQEEASGPAPGSIAREAESLAPPEPASAAGVAAATGADALQGTALVAEIGIDARKLLS
ncbi:hypothetical protein GCM10028798_25150 [Humibacter antri]